MSRKELKPYLKGLSKAQLEEQILDLYDRFKQVKTFYDFAFQPNEEKLIEEARFKIGKEYFPIGNRKAKLRPSVAQKLIKHFKLLEMNPMLLADLMFFNIETAQAFKAENTLSRDAFYKSMFRSFEEAIDFVFQNGLFQEFDERINRIVQINQEQNWPNSSAFTLILEQIQVRRNRHV